MNIVFFGASVTQQQHNSGFVTIFKNLINENKKDIEYNVIQRGFGSMHLYDAGICKINTIINDNPKYCFIDWFSTGMILNQEDELFKYLDTIVRKLMLINSKICFLLLDRIDICENRLKMYNNVKKYCKLYNLHYIELYNILETSIILRDSVHTNEEGAKFYSNKIYKYFVEHMLHDDTVYINIPLNNKYSNIKSIDINKEITDEINITGNFEIIGIYQKIGNFSGLVEITRNNENTYKYNLWDEWCHFTRDNIKINIPLSYKVKIKILQDNFNTEKCKKDIDFSKFKKYMHIHEIYYIGELTIE